MGVNRDASLEEIKKAYRAKAKLYHPDVSDSPKAQEYFSLLNEAHTALTDDSKRYLHDLKLKYGHSAGQAIEKTTQHASSNKRGPYSKFHYDWDSFRAAQRKKKTLPDQPFIYNLFFAAGMFIGFFMCYISIKGVYMGIMPYPTVLVVVPGLVLIRDGWRGIAGKQRNLLTWIINQVKKN